MSHPHPSVISLLQSNTFSMLICSVCVQRKVFS